MPFKDKEVSEGQRIRLCMRAQGLARTFSAVISQKVIDSRRLEHTAYLSSEGLKKGKRFTGATLGLYVRGELWGEFTDWEERRL